MPDLFITYMKDKTIQDTYFEFLELKSLEEVMELMRLGYAYCERERKGGAFAALDSVAL